MIIDQVEVQQVQRLRLIADIADTKNTLPTVHALAPEPEQRRSQLQGELGGVGVKRRLCRTQAQQTLQPRHYPVVIAGRIGQLCLQRRQ